MKKRAANKELTLIAESLGLISELGLSKRMGKAGVLQYVILNVDGDYLLNKSLREVVAETGYDFATVQSTFAKLQERKILTLRGYSCYELNADKLHECMKEGAARG